MPVLNRKKITVAEAKTILENSLYELDPLQRRVHDYTTRISKISAENAKKLVNELINNEKIEQGIAVQIANSMPSSRDELRTLLGRRRIISEDVMNNILKTIEKYKE